MALSKPARQTTVHFWGRFAGLTGLAVVAVGLVIYGALGGVLGLVLAAAGGAVAVLALLVEARGAAGQLLSRRGAVGSNVLVQVLLAVVLVIGANVFSFFHYQRCDLTRDHTFTLDENIRDQLAQLRDETRIVVFQRHTAAGQLGANEDDYDTAAERKIVEKVKDLAEQFQELGPRFRVELVDIQKRGYQDRLNALKNETPRLAEAIEKARENSIFFYAGGQVQRLGFHDVYQLDKVASRQANGAHGNLVLHYQGAEPFARKVLNIDERPPQLTVAVVHELLGLESPPEDEGKLFGLAGAKKALVQRGFRTRDVILKKWSEDAPPEPAVLTYDESRYERLEEQQAELEANIAGLEKELRVFRKLLDDWRTKSTRELSKTDLAKQMEVDQVTEPIRQTILKRLLEPNTFLREASLKQAKQEKEVVLQEKGKLNVEDLTETRRITDVRAKLQRLLADCDLLVVPRQTLFNVTRNDIIPNRVHRVEGAQFEAIKDFMRRGKPVLFCLGPSNVPPPSPTRPQPPEPEDDPVEGLLKTLGFRLPKQTILYNVESKMFAERRLGPFFGGSFVEVPPLEIDWPPGAGAVSAGALLHAPELPPHPIRASLRLAVRAAGAPDALDIRLRHPRPVYFEPPPGSKAPPYDPVFLMTNPESWNEDQPFPTPKHTPRFEPSKPGDPDVGTIREHRRGYFPVAVAVETTVPDSWYAKKPDHPTSARVAVIGHGGAFMGDTISPAKEKLLLDVANWLLGRDELLAHEGPAEGRAVWQFPRVDLPEAESSLWQWGARLGLPLLFVYLGLTVWMVRRMR